MNASGRSEKDDAARVHAVEDEIQDGANKDMPDGRVGLPPGTLRPPYLGPQGDENRDGPLDPAGRPTAPAKPPA